MTPKMAVDHFQVRKFGAWRRRSEPCREASLPRQTEAEPGASAVKTRDEARESSGTLQVEIANASSTRTVDPEPTAVAAVAPQPQRIVPESLERIVEQLVLQNVEIQRILQRKKRRASERQPSRPYIRAESATLDEGIYDALMTPTTPSEVAEETSDMDGDYVTIRAESGGHFSRCHLRRSLGNNRSPESMMMDTPQMVAAGVANFQSLQQQQQQKATLSRSLSCPARGQPAAARLAKKSEASVDSGTSTVGGRIQKLLNHIGSPDHWSNWIRSLSPPQRQRIETDASSSRSGSRREPIDLDVDPMNTSASPCVPSVWLQMQSEHLAEPGKKSGSLPRSFQVRYSQF